MSQISLLEGTHPSTDSEAHDLLLSYHPYQTLVSCPGLNVVLRKANVAPPGKKRSGERSQISWAYSQKVVRYNQWDREIVDNYFTTVIPTYRYPYLI